MEADLSNIALSKEVEKASARIKNYVYRTPLRPSIQLSKVTDANVFLKMESQQITGSFKVRGAFNKVLKYSERNTQHFEDAKFFTASSGNHGLAMTLALRTLGKGAVVYVTENCSEAKEKSLLLRGAELRKFGSDCVLTELESQRAAKEENGVYISPYNDADVMAGQGTLAVEILEDCKDLDAVFVTVGGGGLIGGVSAYLKHCNPNIQVIGCSPINSNCMEQSVKAGRQFDIVNEDTLSDGSAGNIEIPTVTFPVCRRNIDRWVNVTEKEISDAMFLLLDVHHQIVEGAAGCALACFLKVSKEYAGKNVAVVLCGSNVPTNVIKHIVNSLT